MFPCSYNYSFRTKKYDGDGNVVEHLYVYAPPSTLNKESCVGLQIGHGNKSISMTKIVDSQSSSFHLKKAEDALDNLPGGADINLPQDSKYTIKDGVLWKDGDHWKDCKEAQDFGQTLYQTFKKLFDIV